MDTSHGGQDEPGKHPHATGPAQKTTQERTLESAKWPRDTFFSPKSKLLDVAAVERFASEFRETYKGKWVEAERLGGFCLLLKREVLRRVTNQGQLDKWTDLSLFDTDILSAKAREAGFTLAVCRDLFIHHFGTRIFAHGANPTTGTSEKAPTR